MQLACRKRRHRHGSTTLYTVSAQEEEDTAYQSYGSTAQAKAILCILYNWRLLSPRHKVQYDGGRIHKKRFQLVEAAR